MKYYFENAQEVLDGIKLLCDELKIEIAEKQNADIFVEVFENEKNTLSVELSGKSAKITYGGGKSRFFRGIAMLADWVKNGETDKKITQNPLFERNGAMVDMSRNAVMNVESVKCLFRKMALMGFNTFMLYTEDTYEIDGYPYFGYMRGRYTKEEIKDMDAYALKLGIELIPCIQTLGHLLTHLRWPSAGAYQDTAWAMLVGEEETYKIIDAMLKSVKECFTTDRIHIGMDETHDLGTGKYLEKNGYKERSDIYFEHMMRVGEMVKAYGLKPMMWSDMFFRLGGKGLKGYVDYDVRVNLDELISEKVPKGIQQVFWDYYNAGEEFYAVNIDKHKKYLDEETIFAGGVWLWSGHAPHFARSLRNTVPALEACKKKGVKEILATVWVNGSYANHMLSLPGLAWYADFDYNNSFDIESVKNCLRFSCGISYDDIIKTELVEYPHKGEVGISRELLYNDPLMGLVDKDIEGVETISYYKNVTSQLEAVTSDKGATDAAFDVIIKLSSLLENKADFGIRLKKAYDNNDAEALKNLAEECEIILDKIRALHESHYIAWMQYNKPQGWEVHDIRYGGLRARFETTKKRILAYLSNEITAIEELREERLRLDCKADGAEKFGEDYLWYKYPAIATANIL